MSASEGVNTPMTNDYPPPEGFRHGVPIQVRWADLDAMGHVNNAKYLTYLEQAVSYTHLTLPTIYSV